MEGCLIEEGVFLGRNRVLSGLGVVVVSTVTLTGDENNRRFKRSNDEELLKLMLAPSKVQPVLRTAEPYRRASKFSDEDNFSANVIL